MTEVYVVSQQFCVQRSAESLFCKNLGLNGQIVTDCILDVECPSAAIIVEYIIAVALTILNLKECKECHSVHHGMSIDSGSIVMMLVSSWKL